MDNVYFITITNKSKAQKHTHTEAFLRGVAGLLGRGDGYQAGYYKLDL